MPTPFKIFLTIMGIISLASYGHAEGWSITFNPTIVFGVVLLTLLAAIIVLLIAIASNQVTIIKQLENR